MSDTTEVVIGPNGEVFLVLRKMLPSAVSQHSHECDDEGNAVIIDMFEDEEENIICYEM